MSYSEKQQPHDPHVAAQIPVQGQAPPAMPKTACCTIRTASIFVLLLYLWDNVSNLIIAILLFVDPSMSNFYPQNAKMPENKLQIWRTACIFEIVGCGIGGVMTLFALFGPYKGKAPWIKIHLGFSAASPVLVAVGTIISTTTGITTRLIDRICLILAGLLFFYVYHRHYKYWRDVEVFKKRHSGSLDINSYKSPA